MVWTFLNVAKYQATGEELLMHADSKLCEIRVVDRGVTRELVIFYIFWPCKDGDQFNTIGKISSTSDHLRVIGTRGYEATREDLHGNSV